MVATCCCCFDLKYGYLAYVAISVAIRTTLMVLFYFILQAILSAYDKKGIDSNIQLIAPLIGWFIISILFCLLAITGIIQDRSILIYPYFVILIGEVVVLFIVMLTLAFLVTPFILFAVFALVGIYTYDLMCLMSLYKTIKNREVAVDYQNISL